MSVIDVFRPEVGQAIRATMLRKIASFGSMAAIVALAVTFGAITPWWLWLILLGAEFVVFLGLGNYWAGRDALAAERRRE